MITNYLWLFVSFQLLFLWFIYYHFEIINKLLNNIDWYFKIFCALICYYTLGKSSSLTWTKEDGEIVKQIFIGY